MISLIDWFKSVSIAKQKPSESLSIESTLNNNIKMYEGLVTLKSLANSMGEYRLRSSLEDNLNTVQEKLKILSEAYIESNYIIPKALTSILKLDETISISLDNLKSFCDLNNLLLVDTSLLKRNTPYVSDADNSYCLISLNNLDITEINYSLKPFYIGANIKSSLSNILMYLPVIAAMPDETQKRNLYGSIQEDIKSYITSEYPSEILGHIFINNDIATIHIKNINSNPYKFKTTNKTLNDSENCSEESNVYESILIKPVGDEFTFEGSTKTYKTISATKSGIRAYLSKVK